MYTLAQDAGCVHHRGADLSGWVTAGFGLLLLAGLATNVAPWPWPVIALVLYGLPLASRALPAGRLRRFGAWVGVFMVLHAGITVALYDPDLKKLPGGMDVSLDFVDKLPGVDGVQHITTDASGFRASGQIDYANDSPARVFAIGGSTTEQIYLDDRSTWTHLLERALGEPFEIVNAGVSGTRSRHYLVMLEHAIALGADAAIFLVGVNDWNWHIRDAQAEGIGAWTWRVSDATRAWALANGPFGRALWQAWSAMTVSDSGEAERIVARLDARRGSLDRADRRAFNPDAVAATYEADMAAIAERCRESGLACVFVTQPAGYRPGATADYRAGFWMTPPYERYTLSFEDMARIASLYNDWLIDFGTREGIPVCDSTGWTEPGFRHFYDDVHLNVAGAGAMAEGLAWCLADVGWPDRFQ